MSEKALLIDTSLCMGCRACQVACKQWWQHEAEETVQSGTFQNPPELSWKTWSLVRFNEGEADGKMYWYFVKDQCRHCKDPAPCSLGCPNGAISKNEYGGVVIDQTKCGNCDLECVKYCSYDVPKPEMGPDGEEYCRVFKCRLCYDRIEDGKTPACATTCPTGAISFGDKADVVALAEARVKELGGEANIYPNTDGNSMWILLAGNAVYNLAEYREFDPGKGIDKVKPKRRLAAGKLASPVGAAAVVGGSLLGAVEALRRRKVKIAKEDKE